MFLVYVGGTDDTFCVLLSPMVCSEVIVAERLRHSQQQSTSSFLHCIVGAFEHWPDSLNVTEMGYLKAHQVFLKFRSLIQRTYKLSHRKGFPVQGNVFKVLDHCNAVEQPHAKYIPWCLLFRVSKCLPLVPAFRELALIPFENGPH